MAKFAVVLFTCSLLLGNCGHHADIFITNSCFYLAKKNMHSMLNNNSDKNINNKPDHMLWP